MFLFPRFGVIFGPTFYQLEADSVKRINSHIGLIYNSMDFIGVINLMTVLEVTCAERAVFYREHMSNYYGPLSYSLSLWFAEVPYLIFVIVLFVTIEYWLVVNVAVGALSCLFNLFSGYLLPRPAMMAGYKWFTCLMPSSYSLAALVGVQFGEAQDVISVTDGGVTTEMTVAQYIEDTYDFRPNRKYNFMVGLMVIWAVLQMAIYLTFNEIVPRVVISVHTERPPDQTQRKRARLANVFADDAPRCFPADFMFGSATASYQVEGAWNEGGRTPSIWDDFCRTHHRTKVVCANVADAFYHRYRDNVKLMVDTGLQSSRFSVSWSRAMNWNPETKRMQLNPQGLAFYHALVDELIANNIVPILTLGAGAPGLKKSDTFAYIVAHNVHAAVVKAFRDLKASSPPVLDQKARIGITLNSDAAYSLDERNPLDVACSGKEDAVRTVLVPLTSGYWRLSGNHAGTSGRSLAEIHNRGDGAIEGIVQQQALSSSSWRPTQPVPTTKYGRFFLFHSGVVDATSSFIRDESYRWIHELHTEHHLVGLKVDTAHFTTSPLSELEALHVPKLRLVFIKEHRQGAISMVSQLGLFVLAAVGSKLIVYEFKSKQLIGCVLYDSADTNAKRRYGRPDKKEEVLPGRLRAVPLFATCYVAQKELARCNRYHARGGHHNLLTPRRHSCS
ncbi:ATP-binding Cassette (ABC) Superfamily [Phytophthora infestans T30-4]|uniref:ATP-binding Cassette (ABC) Superfamily n=1 Tax=Phytophthora infestans (strain T30-4) TaxID=403677 RepID=D0P170_PHYIT|nr:ATP-binding Cassette (ABC) Superfamily [Phytophthora infestans T30-4]EEY54093.1 ATP-binding Cassette (ABC) Superfamily [Phytophthora infestans T30-4]|eukprot:XP_002895945.1 ATP-binding Cassette (ABC) Superfamily [Phytophthora infestans T30-4]